MHPFRIGVTSDMFDDQGRSAWGDFGLDAIDANDRATWTALDDTGPELLPDDVDGYDGILVNGPHVTARTVSGPRPPRVIARFGVGFDAVDLDACTRAGVLVTNTPTGVRRPVALSALTLLLALAHRLPQKDALVRAGAWQDRLRYRGSRITGATVGIVGLGNIGREVLTLLAPLGMRHVAYDPFVAPELAESVGAELMGLDDLLHASDYVIVTVALTSETRGLLSAARIAQMRPTAFLINVSRGPVLDQDAVLAALRERRIAGAGLDVFAVEPLPGTDPLVDLDNVILTPHALCWTDELALGNGEEAIGSLLDIAAGRRPQHIVNVAALEHPRWRDSASKGA